MGKSRIERHHRWCVMRDADVDTLMHHPYLRQDHAERLAAILNEIETDRVERLLGVRQRGVGDVYRAQEMPTS